MTDSRVAAEQLFDVRLPFPSRNVWKNVETTLYASMNTGGQTAEQWADMKTVDVRVC